MYNISGLSLKTKKAQRSISIKMPGVIQTFHLGKYKMIYHDHTSIFPLTHQGLFIHIDQNADGKILLRDAVHFLQAVTKEMDHGNKVPPLCKPGTDYKN